MMLYCLYPGGKCIFFSVSPVISVADLTAHAEKLARAAQARYAGQQ
jgi:hypothetical protein